MSKKKQRYKRKKGQKKPQYNSSVDSHHIFFCRRDWQKSSACALRRHWYCIVQIPKTTLHSEIHAHVSNVPVPKKCNVEGILFQLNLLEKYNAIHPYDTIEKRLKVLIALTECSEQPTADALKAQLEVVNRFKPS